MNTPQFKPLPRHTAALLAASLCGAALALASGCSGLLPKPAPAPLTYMLDGPRTAGAAAAQADTNGAPALLVNPTRAAPGYETPHIMYTRSAHQLEHYAHSDWIDSPAHMLSPLVVAAAESAGSFRLVGPVITGASADMRLDTEVLRLQQEFGAGASRVRFTLRAYLLDNATRRVIAWREFDATADSATQDALGGVVAANAAVQDVLVQLARFCAQASASWRATRPPPADAIHTERKSP